MVNATFHTTALTLRALDRLLKSNFRADGLENLSERPTMYVINHFTRAETFIMPYIIWKYAGHYCRSLADAKLFKGPLANYFEQMGVISTKQKDRDKLIIGNLMSGRHNWVIYPEGAMVKTKKLITKGKVRLTTPGHIGPPHRGAAVLALKAEICKRQILQRHERGDDEAAEALCQEYLIDGVDDLSDAGTVLVPVTISYYPLRPGQNFIKRICQTYFGELPPRLEEELEIEGNLFLRNTDININFGKPLEIGDYVRRYMLASKFVPVLRSLDRSNLLLRAQSRKITESFMATIYSNTAINIDHLVCTALHKSTSHRLSLDHLRRAVCLAGFKLRNDPKYRMHPTLGLELVRLLTGSESAVFEDILALGERMEVLKRDGDDIVIDPHKLRLNHMFHSVRVKNPMSVISNELEPFADVVADVDKLINTDPAALRRATADAVLVTDKNDFEQQYRQYFEPKLSHSMEVGEPFLLRAPDSRSGVVLAHGYSSAPAEVRQLAEHLHDQGHNVYAVRLWGHGTAPHNLDEISWQDWLHTYLRGYACLRDTCDHVVLGGFSTGGLIALMAATEIGQPVDGIFSICAPSRLKDIRAAMVPAMNWWNDLLDKFNINKAQIEYVESNAENPHINYRHIYVSGLVQLDKFMKKAMRALPQLQAPALVMHGSNDPTVDPRAADRIYRAIGSEDKEFELVTADRHVIVNGKECDHLYRHIGDFVGACCLQVEKGLEPPIAVPVGKPDTSAAQIASAPRERVTS